MSQFEDYPTQNGAYPLSFLNEGDYAEIIEFNKYSAIKNNSSMAENFLRLDEMGLRSGNVVQMLNNSNSHSILIKIENSRLAIPRKIAMKILVRN